MMIEVEPKPQPVCPACHHPKSNHSQDIGCELSCACSEFRTGDHVKSKPQPETKSPKQSGRKNFFAKPLTKRAIRRLKRELGTTGMSRQAINAGANQILERQGMSSAEKKRLPAI
jgi:hypothetical protein